MPVSVCRSKLPSQPGRLNRLTNIIGGVWGLLLAGVLIWQSWLSIGTTGFSFFTSNTWDLGRQQFGSLTFVYGTCVTSLIAMLIAVPLGVGTAAFLSEIASARSWVGAQKPGRRA